MGTSKSYPTPSGGGWTHLKNDITDKLSGNQSISADQIIGGTVRALGGLGAPPGAGGSASGSFSGEGGGRISGGSTKGGRRSVSGAAAVFGGFGSVVRDKGLDAALGKLGLDELKGKPAAEVISRIAEHLCEGEDTLQHEVLVDALKNALLEAAALEEKEEHVDLETALQGFLEQNGVEGLVETFLSNYVFDRVWFSVENHSQLKADTATSFEALGIAIAQPCRGHVEDLLKETKDAGRFEKIDWFGKNGIQLADDLVAELESRLRDL